jgi:hypothetical protein
MSPQVSVLELLLVAAMVFAPLALLAGAVALIIRQRRKNN